MYFVYLDEFGHIGPFVSRGGPKYNESPVFGLAGLILPVTEVRPFATWFFQQKCRLLDFEIKKAGAHPASWEKKGSALYTLKNVSKYRELRAFTNRFFHKISSCGGAVIYVGLHKQATVEQHKPSRLYLAVLKEMLKRLNSHFENDESRPNFLLIIDQHQDRESLLTEAGRAMFGKANPRRRLIEPPFQAESHRYQTIQAADWICGILGRLAPFWIAREEYKDAEIMEKYFGPRLRQISVSSGIRGDRRLQTSTLVGTPGLKEII